MKIKFLIELYVHVKAWLWAKSTVQLPTTVHTNCWKYVIAVVAFVIQSHVGSYCCNGSSRSQGYTHIYVTFFRLEIINKIKLNSNRGPNESFNCCFTNQLVFYNIHPLNAEKKNWNWYFCRLVSNYIKKQKTR